MRVAMSQVPCLHEHLANAATTSSYAAGVVMVKNKELEELSMNSTALGAENTKKESIALALTMIPEEMRTAFMILKQVV